MLYLVPRSQEGVGSISINGLGFAGAFLVRSASERDQLVAFGLMKALTVAGLPRASPRPQSPPT